MKKITIFIVLFITITNCSFDNKSGIWKNESDIKKKINKPTVLENVFLENSSLSSEKTVSKQSIILINKKNKNKNWTQNYFNLGNNVSNIHFKDLDQNSFKSGKLSKFKLLSNINSLKTNNPIFINDKLIYFDHKGTIFIYSLSLKEKVFKYNFYKKKYKNLEKKIYLALFDDIIYASDNFGYLYALDINNKKILWAKNFGIPFRSNIKIFNNEIILANQDNIIYSINKDNGDKNWQFATNLQFLKSSFINNIAIDVINNNILFLNTSGELYSINTSNNKINWMNNFKSPSMNEDTQIFLSSPVIIDKETIFINSNSYVQAIDAITGVKKWTINISSQIKPTISGNSIFLVTSDKFLTCLDLYSGDIYWSRKIDNLSNDKKNKKIIRRAGEIFNLTLVENKIFLFTTKGFLFKIDYKNGNLLSLKKYISSGFGSNPIFADGKMYFFDKKFKFYEFQ